MKVPHLTLFLDTSTFPDEVDSTVKEQRSCRKAKASAIVRGAREVAVDFKPLNTWPGPLPGKTKTRSEASSRIRRQRLIGHGETYGFGPLQGR